MKVLFVTGELSGDMHASAVAARMMKTGGPQIYAVGGENFKKIKARIIHDNKDMAVVGLWEVLRHYDRIRGILHKVVNWTRENQPDLVVLVDYPGFNLRLAPKIRKYCKKLVYYISPQVWAWKYGRVRKIQRWFDEVIVILPFEAPIYRREGIPVSYFGHPLTSLIKRKKVRMDSALKPSRILFMPGSREAEIRNHMPIFNGLLSHWKDNAGLEFSMACADSIDKARLCGMVSPEHRDKITVVKGSTYGLLDRADMAIVASGTASLEASLFQKPVIVVYKVHWLSMVFFRLLSKVRFISLTNIIMDRQIIREFLSFRTQLKDIIEEAEKLMNDRPYRMKMAKGLAMVRKSLDKGDSYGNTARHLAGILGKLAKS